MQYPWMQWRSWWLYEVLWVSVRSFESEVIKGSKMLLVSKFYSTCDLDLLISLSVFPDSINCFSSRKAPLSTKCIAKLIVESKHLIQIIWRRRWCLVGFLVFIPGSTMFIHFGSPCIVIASLVISIHPIVFNTTAVMISGAPIEFFFIDDNFVFFLNQTPCWNGVRTVPFAAVRAISANTSVNFFLLLSCKRIDLFVKFQLELSNFSAKCNDLILLTKLLFPCSVFKHIVVRFDHVATNVWCATFLRIPAKVFVPNDIDFCFETLWINSKNSIEIIHDILRFVICTGDFLFDGDTFCLLGQMPFDNAKAIVGRFIVLILASSA